MTSRHRIRVNDKEVLMFSDLKPFRHGVIEKQFKDIAIWVPTLRNYMNDMNEDLVIRATSSVSVYKKELPEEFFYRYTKKTDRVLVQYGTKQKGDRVVVVNPILRTKDNIPWFMVTELGDICTCVSIGQPDFECEIHHMSIEGHHIMCGCNGEGIKNWGLPTRQYPLVEVLPNFVPRQGQRPNSKTIKRVTKFKIEEFEAKPPNRK